MIARALALLDRDPERALIAGLGLVVLGVAVTLRALADAAGQWSEALSLGDRAVLGLFTTSPVSALPFLVGALLVVVALRLEPREAGPIEGVVAGIAYAYLALGVCAALAAADAGLSGTFGDGSAAVELTNRQRSFDAAEQILGSLGVAVAALAIARAVLAPPREPAPVAAAVTEGDGAAADASALAAAGNGRPAGVAAPEHAAEPEPSTPAERYRRLYERRLRYSPRAAEARTLIARLHDDPGDTEAADALDRLAGERID